MKDIKKIEIIIEKARNNKQKTGMLAYWSYINKRYIINYINVSFLKKDRKVTMVLIEKTEQTDGFLFWANSPEGENFYLENYNKIAESIKNQQIKPWEDYEYRVKKDES